MQLTLFRAFITAGASSSGSLKFSDYIIRRQKRIRATFEPSIRAPLLLWLAGISRRRFSIGLALKLQITRDPRSSIRGSSKRGIATAIDDANL